MYVERADGSGARSETRLVRVGFVPGKVINYLHPEDTAYAFSGTSVDSPSLVKLPTGRLIDLPIRDSKSPILFDDVTGRYYMLCNYAPEGANVGRTICALMWSEDLESWTLDRLVMDFREQPPKLFGIQYFDYVFDGEDIVFISRTACCGASNFHDANHQTFHRIKNFRGEGK